MKKSEAKEGTRTGEFFLGKEKGRGTSLVEGQRTAHEARMDGSKKRKRGKGKSDWGNANIINACWKEKNDGLRLCAFPCMSSHDLCLHPLQVKHACF